MAGFNKTKKKEALRLPFFIAKISGIKQFYSIISSTERFFNLVEAAFKIVLRDLAVRPCLPIIFPKSVLSTLSSITVVCSPTISFTVTASGISTRALLT